MMENHCDTCGVFVDPWADLCAECAERLFGYGNIYRVVRENKCDTTKYIQRILARISVFSWANRGRDIPASRDKWAFRGGMVLH